MPINELPTTAKIWRFVGEGTFPLCLRIVELEDLEGLTGVGSYTLWRRLMPPKIGGTLDWRVADVKGILRLGLIGAGMDDERAHDIVERAVRETRLEKYASLAAEVIHGALYGYPEGSPLVGEPPAPVEEESPKTAESAGATITTSPEESNSTRSRSKSSPSAKPKRSSKA